MSAEGIVGRESVEQLKERVRMLETRNAELEEKNRQLEEISRTDELTKLLNKRGFLEASSQMESAFARADIGTALIAFDLDGFKQVNDIGGHALGDRCLVLVATEVKNVLRDSDIFARTGGDEFTIFFSSPTVEAPSVIAEKVRKAIETRVTETLRNERPEYTGTVSASIGIAIPEHHGAHEAPHMDEILKQADYALYVVKAAGKKAELTVEEAKQLDTDGKYRSMYLAGEELPR